MAKSKTKPHTGHPFQVFIENPCRQKGFLTFEAANTFAQGQIRGGNCTRARIAKLGSNDTVARVALHPVRGVVTYMENEELAAKQLFAA